MSNLYLRNNIYWRITALTLISLCILSISIVQTSGVDFWLLARIGEVIVSGHAIPDTLLFPFTEVADQHFNAHEWLPSIVFHALIKLLGEDQLPFVAGLLGLSYFALATRLALLRSDGNKAIALIGGIAAIATENYRHVLRPELISLLLMAAYWAELERFRRFPSLSTAFKAGMLTTFWANSHGSFILAPTLAGLYTVGTHLDTMRQRRVWCAAPSRSSVQLAIFGALMVGATLLNPFGIELIQFVLNFGSSAELQHAIVEWMPTFSPLFHKAPGVWLGTAVAALTFLVLAINWRRTSAVDWLVFAFFIWLACRAIRFPVYLGLVAAWVAPAYAPACWREAIGQRRTHQVSCTIALLVASLTLRFGNANGQFPYSPGFSKLSDGMLQVIANQNYKGNVYTSLELGSELIYRAYPRLRPSIDCRIDSYGLDYLEYQKALLYNTDLMNDFLRRYDVGYMLIDQTKFKLLQQLDSLQHGKWRILYMDRNSVFLQRSDLSID